VNIGVFRAALAGVALAAAALASPIVAHADVTTPGPTRVLILGDSITQGRAGDITWRYHYWNAFRAHVDLVGPKRGEWDGGGFEDETSARYPYSFDYDHAARWGMELSRMNWTVADLTADYTPDVVVSQIGLNDLTNLTDPEGLIALQRSFVQELRAADADTDVVLGQLSVTWYAEVAEYNALLPALVAELDTPASRIVMATMPPMTEADDSRDGIHPNAAGEVKISTAHEAALASLGVQRWTEPATPPPDVPTPTPTPTPTPAWSPAPHPVMQAPGGPTKVKMVDRGRRVRVTWRIASRATSYSVRCGTVRVETVGVRVWFTTSSARCWVRAVNAAGASSWVRATDV
jgi:lysophospholipase L1-like esterase